MDRLGLGPQQQESRVLLATPAFRVRTYPSGAGSPPVLLVAAPIKRAYIWDLLPPASTVRLLADAGFAVHLLEWLDPAPSDAERGLAAYADVLLGEAVAAVTEDSGRAPVVVGHSLGGTLAAAFCARHPDRVRGVVLLEAPLHFGRDAGAFAPLVAATPDVRRLRPPPLVPGTVLDLMTVLAAPVGPRSMVVPMLTVVDPASTAIPPRSIQPFHRAAAARDKELLEYHGDRGVALQHVGVLVGRNAHDSLWPQIVEWVRRLR